MHRNIKLDPDKSRNDLEPMSAILPRVFALLWPAVTVSPVPENDVVILDDGIDPFAEGS